MIFVSLILILHYLYHSFRYFDNHISNVCRRVTYDDNYYPTVKITISHFGMAMRIILYTLLIIAASVLSYSNGKESYSDYSEELLFIIILPIIIVVSSLENMPKGILRIVATILLCIIPLVSLTGYFFGVKYKNDNTVYILEHSGMNEKYRQYHKENCQYRSWHCDKVMLEQAREKGYTPCDKCIAND